MRARSLPQPAILPQRPQLREPCLGGARCGCPPQRDCLTPPNLRVWGCFLTLKDDVCVCVGGGYECCSPSCVSVQFRGLVSLLTRPPGRHRAWLAAEEGPCFSFLCCRIHLIHHHPQQIKRYEVKGTQQALLHHTVSGPMFLHFVYLRSFEMKF